MTVSVCLLENADSSFKWRAFTLAPSFCVCPPHPGLTKSCQPINDQNPSQSANPSIVLQTRDTKLIGGDSEVIFYWELKPIKGLVTCVQINQSRGTVYAAVCRNLRYFWLHNKNHSMIIEVIVSACTHFNCANYKDGFQKNRDNFKFYSLKKVEVLWLF